MAKAGIAVDDWKLPVFRRQLTAAGFEYEDRGPLTGDTTMLAVETDDVPRLAALLKDCQAECAKKWKP